LKLRQRENVADDNLLDIFAFLARHELEGADTLVFALVDVENVVIGSEASGVDADERELADVWVHHDFEADGGESGGRVRSDFYVFVALLRGTRTGFERRREKVDDEVEYLMHAHILRG